MSQDVQPEVGKQLVENLIVLFSKFAEDEMRDWTHQHEWNPDVYCKQNPNPQIQNKRFDWDAHDARGPRRPFEQRTRRLHLTHQQLGKPRSSSNHNGPHERSSNLLKRNTHKQNLVACPHNGDRHNSKRYALKG